MLAPKQLDTTKDLTMKGGRIYLVDGDASSVSLGFRDHPNTGFYRSSDGSMGFAQNGVSRLHINPLGVISGAFSGSITGSADTAVKLSSSRTFSLTGDATASVTSDLATGVSLAVTLKDIVGLTPGTYNSLTVDQKGRITSGTVISFTKSLVGLGNADNTSDALKPISNATQAALNLKLNSSAFVPVGNTSEVIYNNAGAWGSASNLMVEGGYLKLAASLPTIATNGVILGAKDHAGRTMPAWVDSNGLDITPQPHIGRNCVSQWTPQFGATTLSIWGMSTATATGKATARSPANTSLLASLRRTGFVSAGTSGSLCGYRQPTAQWWRGNVAGAGGFHYIHTFGISDASTLSTAKMFVGLSASTAAPTNVEPNTLVNSVGLGKMSTSANLCIITNDATTGFTPIDLGVNFPGTVVGDIYTLTLFAPPNGSFIGYKVERVTTGMSVSGTLTTDLPVNTTFLTLQSWRTNSTILAAAGLDLISLYIETDN